MNRYTVILVLIWFVLFNSQANAQETMEADTNESRNAQLGGEGYRINQYPGLSEAASKIFFTDSWVAFSGYLEVNQIIPADNYRDRSSEELELYYSDLYRISPFVGFRLSKKIMLTLELQVEYLRDNDRADELHFNPELYFDVLFSKGINLRAGIFPLSIGYINNNEEPILFYSVNRPDVERLLIPTGWNEMGLGIYGAISNDWHYFLNLTNGVQAKEFRSPTWIRGGRDVHFTVSRPAVNFQLNYVGIKNLTISGSGYFGNSGQGEKLENTNSVVESPLGVLSGYVRWDGFGIQVIGMGMIGNQTNTPDIYELTRTHNQDSLGQVIGDQVHGGYLEIGYDLLSHVFPKRKSGSGKDHGIFRIDKPEFPIFLRYERLNTHARVSDELKNAPYFGQNADIIVAGFNYEPNHDIVIKVNYKQIWSRDAGVRSEQLIEIGLGASF